MLARVLPALALVTPMPVLPASKFTAGPAPFLSPLAEAPPVDPPDCPAPPPPPARLDVPSPYRLDDPSFSRIDPERLARHRAALATLHRFTSGVALQANRYVATQGRNRDAGSCAIAWLGAWAGVGALEKADDHMAQFSRSVGLAAWSIAFSGVSGLDFTGRDDPRPAIAAWLVRLARDTATYYEGLASVPARNNHRYWAGLATVAAASQVNDRDLADRGIASCRIGLDQVATDGSLPLEIARRSHARNYHFYAAGPLVLCAEYARGFGVDLYRENDGALHRLVAFALASLDDPAAIERMAGEAQSPFLAADGSFNRQSAAFVEIYVARFPDRRTSASEVLRHRPLLNPELGGNLTLLATTALAPDSLGAAEASP